MKRRASTGTALVADCRVGKLSQVEATGAALDQTERHDGELNALIVATMKRSPPPGSLRPAGAGRNKDDVDLEARLAKRERFHTVAKPYGAFDGKIPYEALRERL